MTGRCYHVITSRRVTLLFTLIAATSTILIITSFKLSNVQKAHQSSKWKRWRSWSETQGERARNAILQRSRDRYAQMTFLHSNVNKTLVVISVITTNRVIRQVENYKPFYLSQTFNSLITRLEDYTSGLVQFRLALCNVDKNPQAHDEAQSIINRTGVVTFTRFQSKYKSSENPFKKEAEDYMFCLNQTFANFKTDFVVIVEDDTIPNSNALVVLENVVRNMGASKANSTAFVKLHHPERFQAYWSIYPHRWLELVLISLLVAVAVAVTLKSRRRVAFCACFVLVFVSLLITGRRYVLRMRSHLTMFHAVVEAPPCCTPAVMFFSSTQRAVQHYFSLQNIHAGFPKDFALDKLRSDLNLKGYLVEPNLFTHIGLFSSLRNFHMDGIVKRIGNNY